MGKKRRRIYFIMQYELHPDTNEIITCNDENGNVLRDKKGNIINFGLNEEKIKYGVYHKSVERFAYTYHDNDVYSEEDEIDSPLDDNGVKIHKQGEKKPKHWHVALSLKTALDVDTIANWFGIRPNYIEFPKGQGAFEECVEYLTHESDKQQELGKFLYPDEQIEANFDFRSMLDKRREQREKYGSTLTPLEMVRREVGSGCKTLADVQEEYPDLYNKDLPRLKQLRQDYLKNYAKLPDKRMNFYVCPDITLHDKRKISGIGKTLCSQALARSLYPDIKDTKKLFFEVRDKRTAFEEYDGQPVIIWNDFRPEDLVDCCGSYGNLYNLFELYPSQSAGGTVHIKNSSTKLLNYINIVNGPLIYSDFLDGLSDGENKIQGWRRFPYVIPLKQEEFEVYVNRGYAQDDNDEFDHYDKYLTIRGNFAKVKSLPDEHRVFDLENLMSGQIVAITQKVDNERVERSKNTEVAKIEEFDDYGLTDDQIKAKQRWNWCLSFYKNFKSDAHREIFLQIVKTKYPDLTDKQWLYVQSLVYFQPIDYDMNELVKKEEWIEDLNKIKDLNPSDIKEFLQELKTKLSDIFRNRDIVDEMKKDNAVVSDVLSTCLLEYQIGTYEQTVLDV